MIHLTGFIQYAEGCRRRRRPLGRTLRARVALARALPTVFDMGKRRAGGRVAGGRHPDSGLQFLQASEVRLQHVFGMLRREGLIAPWTGRFGVLGSRGGGFLPIDVLRSTPLRGMMRETPGEAETAGVDFCGFLSHDAEAQPLYVGTARNGDIVTGLCEAAGIDTVLGAHVVAATCEERDGTPSWRLECSDKDAGGDKAEQAFDALVLASHDASLASRTISALASTGTDAAPKLMELSAALNAQRAERTAPSFTWSGYFPPGFSDSIPFDAVTVPGSPIVRFLARDASKPGRRVEESEGELWTAVATAEFSSQVLAQAAAITAESGDSERGGQAAATAEKALTAEVRTLLSPYFAGVTPAPVAVSAKRWGAAFASSTLGLSEDCVSLEPWRLAICGDFLRDDYSCPAEAAALSGMEAAERVASWYA